MFIRVRVAIGIALAAILMTSITVFAKGGFDFITITGPGLKAALHVTDTRLTEDFFTFANFYQHNTKAPADPGKGYEITRHYVQVAGDVIFDRLHYYPETAFVFYDGIENGDSEYDGEWYTANSAIKTVFESALAVQAGSAAPAEKKEPVTSSQPVESVAQTRLVSSSLPSRSIVINVMTAGLAVLFAFALWRHKPSTQ